MRNVNKKTDNNHSSNVRNKFDKISAIPAGKPALAQRPGDERIPITIKYTKRFLGAWF